MVNNNNNNNNIVCDIYNIVEDDKAKINDDEKVDYERNNFKFYKSVTTAQLYREILCLIMWMACYQDSNKARS